jgi:ATP-dependent Clp protease ATP-binding subunit ClpB
MTSNIAISPVADANTFFDTRGFLPVRRWDPRDNRSQTVLDPTMQSPEVEDFVKSLRRRVVGQDRAIRQLARIYQVYLAGLSAPGRPLANLLLLGPTGSGKTRLVEAAAEALFGDVRAVVKIDCAEFQHAHEISKLVGSPPGYLGHRETLPLITQETLEQH